MIYLREPRRGSPPAFDRKSRQTTVLMGEVTTKKKGLLLEQET